MTAVGLGKASGSTWVDWHSGYRGDSSREAGIFGCMQVLSFAEL